MNRRGFITGLAGCLASAAAPAIVHNPMRIVVPRLKVVELAFFGCDFGFYEGNQWTLVEVSYLHPSAPLGATLTFNRIPDLVCK